MQKLRWRNVAQAQPKLSISLNQQSEVSCSLFLLHVQVKDYQNILKVRHYPLPFTSYKSWTGTSLSDLFYALFLKKIISHVY